MKFFIFLAYPEENMQVNFICINCIELTSAKHYSVYEMKKCKITKIQDNMQ